MRPTTLVLRALGLGDLCTAVPALAALARARPEHRTVLAAPVWQAPLVDLCPGVDAILPVDGLRALPAAAQGVEIAVNLHGRGPESSRLVAACRPGRLVAFAHPDVPATAGGPRWREDEHEVRRWCRLVEGLTGEEAPDDRSLRVPDEHPVVAGATVVHPGAAAPSRRWPVDRWAEVAAALHRDGHRVVLTGSASEAATTAEIARRAALPRGCDLAGRTGLRALAALVAHARLVVSGDTGPAHLASAYRTPSVLLFGPTPPRWWGPPRDGPHAVLWSGRVGDPHGAVVDPGLLAIQVADVLAAVDQLRCEEVRSA